MGRAPCCDKANVKKGPWSPEEDAKLRSHIEKHGTGGNWIALPQKIGLKRCGKSCRLRWLNYLRPNIKHGGYTEDEDNLICSLYVTIGSRWSIIAAQLPGRTDNDIKNYWNTRLKKKLLGKQCRSKNCSDNNPPQPDLSPMLHQPHEIQPNCSNYTQEMACMMEYERLLYDEGMIMYEGLTNKTLPTWEDINTTSSSSILHPNYNTTTTNYYQDVLFY